jgi:type I restriction enzyme S subunit
MNRYDSYKNSGVEWIEDIPKNWDVIKLKYISNLYNGSSLNDNQKELFESSNMDDIPYVSTKDIDHNSQSIEYDNGLRIPKSNTSFKLGKKDSFLLCIEGGSSGKKMGFLEQDVYFVNKLCCFEPKTNSKFQFYYIQTPIFQSQFNSSLSGLIGGVSISLIKNFISILPPLQEQEQIVKFLDEKTFIIDKLISTKERKIELLKQQRSSLINEVITKGLDPNVKMKDSGVEWIGDIPENFKIITLKKLLQTNNLEFQDGNHGGEYPNPEEFMKIGVPFIKPRDIQNDKIIWDGCDRLPFERCKRFRIGFSNNGDILLVNRGGSIGKVCYVDDFNNEFPYFLINPQVTYLRGKKELTSKYIYYTTKSDVFRCGIDLILGHGSTFPFLGLSNMSDFKMVFPPIKEQEKIVQHLDKQTKEIDDLVHLEQKKIEILKEYRQSLISEVITGKIKVVK